MSGLCPVCGLEVRMAYPDYDASLKAQAALRSHSSQLVDNAAKRSLMRSFMRRTPHAVIDGHVYGMDAICEKAYIPCRGTEWVPGEFDVVIAAMNRIIDTTTDRIKALEAAYYRASNFDPSAFQEVSDG